MEKDCRLDLKTTKNKANGLHLQDMEDTLFQRKFTNSWAAWMEQSGQVSFPWPQEQAEKPRNTPWPQGNPPELYKAAPSSRSALTAAIIFRCDRRVIPPPFLEMSMARLHRLLSSWSSGRFVCPWQGCWNWGSLMSLPTQSIPWLHDFWAEKRQWVPNICTAGSHQDVEQQQTTGFVSVCESKNVWGFLRTSQRKAAIKIRMHDRRVKHSFSMAEQTWLSDPAGFYASWLCECKRKQSPACWEE